MRPDEREERGRVLIHDIIRFKEDAIGVGRIKRERVHADVSRFGRIADSRPVIVARGEIEAFVVLHGSFSFHCPVVPGKYKITYFGIIVKGFLQN